MSAIQCNTTNIHHFSKLSLKPDERTLGDLFYDYGWS